MSEPGMAPSPALFFDTINAYQRTDALKTAIQLGVFGKIGREPKTARELGEACQTAERGMRILCDYLATLGFLTKQDDRYGLTLDSGIFLDPNSPAYVGGAIGFLLSPHVTGAFDQLPEAVKKGGTAIPDEGSTAPEHPMWVDFARAMAPLAKLSAQQIAQLIDPEHTSRLKVLDIAAGHGLFGITLAQQNPNAEVTALDWPAVLEVAKQNAAAAGVTERYKTIPGSAFDAEFGTGYDIVLLTNFLHHFDARTCEALLRKVRGALAPGGRAVTLEFIPDEGRVSPPPAAGFSLVMLATTPSGDAYTFRELEGMFRNAGFAKSTFHPLPPTIQQVVIAE